MDAGDLAIFEAVARLGGMNRAALELHTVQSNVTARIRQLEEELGTALFRRHSRGVALTQAGHRLLPYTSKIGQLLAEARKAVRDDGTPKGSLTIGSLETTAALRLSSHLAAFVTDYPEVDLVLRTGTTAEMVGDVLEYRLEGAFVCGPVDHTDLDQRLAFREELVILTALTARNLDELFANKQFRIVVLRAGCSYRQRLEDILARRGVVDLRLLEFGTIEAILGCAAAGLGVTLLPRSLIGTVTRNRQVVAHELPTADATADTIFIRRRDAFVSSALATFLDRVCLPPTRAEAAE